MTRTLVVTLLFAAAAMAAPWSATAQEAKPPQSVKAAQTPVNLNTATPKELVALPGVGPATAARIVEYREKNGAFKKIEDLMNVRGIGEKTFLTLKPMITVAPPKGVGW